MLLFTCNKVSNQAKNVREEYVCIGNPSVRNLILQPITSQLMDIIIIRILL